MGFKPFKKVEGKGRLAPARHRFLTARRAAEKLSGLYDAESQQLWNNSRQGWYGKILSVLNL